LNKIWQIEISATAEKQLKKLNKAQQKRIIPAILALAQNPRPDGCKKLRGYADVYRIRVGLCRVIYSVEDKRLVVIVLKLGHRRDIYR